MLTSCIDLLNPEKYPDDIVNSVTGEHGNSNINIQDAMKIGVALMSEFTQILPGGLHDMISQMVVTKVARKKHVSVGDTKLYHTNIIYSRVQASGREVDVNNIRVTGAATPFLSC